MKGYLKIKCIEVTPTLEQASGLFEFIDKQGDCYNDKARLIQLYVHLGSLEKLKKAVQHQFPDGTTISQDFKLVEQELDKSDIHQEQAQKAPKQREWGDL